MWPPMWSEPRAEEIKRSAASLTGMGGRERERRYGEGGKRKAGVPSSRTSITAIDGSVAASASARRSLERASAWRRSRVAIDAILAGLLARRLEKQWKEKV